jgi:hypothetical protein
MRQNKSAIGPAFHPPLLCFFRTPDSLWGCLSEIRVDGSAALLGVARRGLSLCFSLYRVEVSIGCKVCLPFHLRVLCFLTQERAKLIENGFILMLRCIVLIPGRQTRAHHPGAGCVKAAIYGGLHCTETCGFTSGAAEPKSRFHKFQAGRAGARPVDAWPLADKVRAGNARPHSSSSTSRSEGNAFLFSVY